MPDIVQTIGKSLIQYGPDNDRIYLMKASRKSGKVQGLQQQMITIIHQRIGVEYYFILFLHPGN